MFLCFFMFFFLVYCRRISNWKKQALSKMEDAFDGKSQKEDDRQQKELDKLYAKIGQLEVEKDFLEQAVSTITA